MLRLFRHPFLLSSRESTPATEKVVARHVEITIEREIRSVYRPPGASASTCSTCGQPLPALLAECRAHTEGTLPLPPSANPELSNLLPISVHEVKS